MSDLDDAVQALIDDAIETERENFHADLEEIRAITENLESQIDDLGSTDYQSMIRDIIDILYRYL